MNDLNESGFRSKAAALLNNEIFSDVEIRVNDGTNTRSFPAHSLFLSMNSKKFANTFHGHSPPPKVFNIFDYKPKIVYMMLEYLYTEKVNFSDTDVARELHTLSKTFEIRNLQELCGEYITRNEIDKENVLNIYECAYEHKYSKSLDLCRRIVSLNTKAIIESPSFVEVSLAVLEDIVKQDTLTVESELDIINAVIKWACHQCNRQNLADTKYLRDCIFPLLGHIRVLNLEYKQFSEVEKYSIFTVQESSLIKRKLLQPDELVHLPPHICHLTKPRMYSTVKINSELDLLSLNPSLSSTVPQNINAVSKRFKKAPVSKVYPQRNVSVRKAFNFSLVEAEKLVSTAFKNDVKCSMSIHLLKGMIIVHGIELTISQSRKTGELINIFLHASNSRENLPGMSDTFNKELKDNMLSIMFDQPMKILENCHAEIEVTIEDLKLNRCCILKDPVCKLHCSDTVGDITLTSNQTNEFIYTDETDLRNTEECKNLYRLAKLFEVKDLEKYCRTYLVGENITLENIFDKYEFALSENLPQALKACRDIVSTRTIDIINLRQFTEISLSVIEDILQLDTMSIMSELDLIEAAIKWAQQECYRRGSLTDNLRICVYPLFKHLRFLTLTAPEFCDLVEKYDKLINAHESSKLTMAILKPDPSLPIPSGFSSNTNRREQSKSMPKEQELLIPATVNTVNINDKKKPSWSFDLDLQDHLRDTFGLIKPPKQDISSKSSVLDEPFSHVAGNIPSKQNSSSKSVKFKENDKAFSDIRQNTTNKQHSMLFDPFEETFPQVRQNTQVKQNLSSSSSKLAENVDVFSKFQNVPGKQNSKPTPIVYNRSESTPIYIKKPSPVLRVKPSPQLSLNQRAFNFPLFDFDNDLNSAFENDIKCSAKIYVNRGAIEIYGVELKMKQKATEEVIITHLSISGSSISSRHVTCEEKLKNNILSLTFGEPVKLYSENNLDIEVVVEDLKLNRCSGCHDDRCELNSGLNVSAEIWMKSNQTNNVSRDFFYLFNRLIYKPLA